jgi:hypothetical protein
MDFTHWSLNDLFKVRDAFVVLNSFGYWWAQEEQKEVEKALRSHLDNPDHERDIKEE